MSVDCSYLAIFLAKRTFSFQTEILDFKKQTYSKWTLRQRLHDIIKSNSLLLQNTFFFPLLRWNDLSFSVFTINQAICTFVFLINHKHLIAHYQMRGEEKMIAFFGNIEILIPIFYCSSFGHQSFWILAVVLFFGSS